jgi:protein involved in polysaccharide export with SLBB domain
MQLTPNRLRLSALFLLALALIVAFQPASAQTGAEVVGDTPIFTNQCSGPLGALLPECQTGRSAVSIAPQTQSGAGGAAPSVKTLGFGGTPAERESVTAPAAAEPPSEFQRFAASSVGQVLPIFGASLFGGVPTTFAPLDRVPVTANYVIGPGDEILLRVWGQVNLDVSLTVDRAGAVFIPQAGNVTVSGLEFQQLSSYLRSQLERVFRNFDLSVNMGQLRSIQIFVVGQARRPGAYTVSSLSTLVNALFASGGPSAQGSMRRIQLKRGVAVQTEFDLYHLLLKGDKSNDARLLPGDVVYIPPVGPQVAIAGSVKTPAIYELKSENKIADLIQMAGLSAFADVERATLERIKDRNSREAIELRLDSAGVATLLSDGDVLKVFTITPKFANAVTLRGNVANPGRFPWHAGMRLRDVIPDKESLVTRDYWKKSNTLGFTPPEDVPGEPAAEAGRKPALIGISSSMPDINWSYAIVERQNAVNLATELIPFHLGKLVLEKDDTQNLELRADDVVTIFSQADFRVAMAQQTRLVRLEGEFAAAGVYAVRPGETLGQLIQRAGGLTPQAYAFGAEFTRESTRMDQQRRLDQFLQELEQDVERTASNRVIGASTAEQSQLVTSRLQSERTLVERMRSLKATGRIVLNIDPGSNDLSKLLDFPLEDSDRFLVPSKPATVNVLGAVYNQNSFIHQSNLRVSDYLRQAGGATRNADTGRLFVIRADGSVVPKRGFNPFSRTFEAAALNPGDSVVVPQAIFRTTFMQGLRDWSLVISQFGLGAAAVNVLR